MTGDPVRGMGIVHGSCLAAVKGRATEYPDVGEHVLAGEAVERMTQALMEFFRLGESLSGQGKQQDGRCQNPGRDEGLRDATSRAVHAVSLSQCAEL